MTVLLVAAYLLGAVGSGAAYTLMPRGTEYRPWYPWVVGGLWPLGWPVLGAMLVMAAPRIIWTAHRDAGRRARSAR